MPPTQVRSRDGPLAARSDKRVASQRVRGIKRCPDEFLVLRSRLLAVAWGLPSSSVWPNLQRLLHRLQLSETLSCRGLSNFCKLTISRNDSGPFDLRAFGTRSGQINSGCAFVTQTFCLSAQLSANQAEYGRPTPTSQTDQTEAITPTLRRQIDVSVRLEEATVSGLGGRCHSIRHAFSGWKGPTSATPWSSETLRLSGGAC